MDFEDKVYSAYYQKLERKYPENVFRSICRAVGRHGVDEVRLVTRNWGIINPESPDEELTHLTAIYDDEKLKPDSFHNKGTYLSFIDEIEALLENQTFLSECSRDWWDDMGGDDSADLTFLDELGIRLQEMLPS